MSYQTVRFIHAANASLDRPVRTTELLDAEHYRILECARDHAFETVVCQCISHKVDFLLLSGDTFSERARSLGSRIVLQHAFDRLNEHGIQVFVVPDRTNPADAWRAMQMLPRNVSICDDWSPEPIAVLRDGKLIATVANGLPHEEPDEFGIQTPTRIPSDEQPVLHVGVCRYRADERSGSSLDDSCSASRAELQPLTLQEQVERFFDESSVKYAAIVALRSPKTISDGHRVGHCPGYTQADSERDGHDGCCSLVELDPAGAIRITSLETASVVFRSFDVDAAKARQADELVRGMWVAASVPERSLCHRLWIVRFTICGDIDLIRSLESDAQGESLTAAFHRTQPVDQELAIAPAVRLLPAADVTGENRPAAAQFMTLLESLMPFDQTRLATIVSEAGLDHTWGDRLTALTREVDPQQIEAQIRRLGFLWFAEVPQEGTAA